LVISHRNWLLKYITEGKTKQGTEVTGRQGKRRKQLLNNVKETRGYWKLKEEALDCTLWKTTLEKAIVMVVRQTME
jgi:hypothetical protein